MRADHVDLFGLRQQFRAEAVEAGRGRRALDAQFREFSDVVFDRGAVSSRPPAMVKRFTSTAQAALAPERLTTLNDTCVIAALRLLNIMQILL